MDFGLKLLFVIGHPISENNAYILIKIIASF